MISSDLELSTTSAGPTSVAARSALHVEDAAMHQGEAALRGPTQVSVASLLKMKRQTRFILAIFQVDRKNEIESDIILSLLVCRRVPRQVPHTFLTGQSLTEQRKDLLSVLRGPLRGSPVVFPAVVERQNGSRCAGGGT